MKLPQSTERLTHEEMTADSNGIAYDVWTCPPPVYDHSGEDTYPLVVLLDGDMFMGAASETVALVSTIGEARPGIVVGVTTAAREMHGIQRTIDYSAEVPTDAILETPEGAQFNFWKIYEGMFASLGMQFEDGFGGTDAFLAFLTDQVLPMVQETYRIDENEIGIAGHSSGGDFAVDTLLRKDTPFSKFIVGSFGTDVLERTLAAREASYAATKSDRKLSVFCGYGGAEETDPYLRDYIVRGNELMQRLKESDPSVEITVRGFDKETHGSVFPHIFSSGYRELWGTGISFVDAVAAAGVQGD